MRAIRRYMGTADRVRPRPGAQQIELPAPAPLPLLAQDSVLDAVPRRAESRAAGSVPEPRARPAKPPAAERTWPSEGRLVATLFSSAAAHDRECLEAGARVLAASETVATEDGSDIDSALDAWRRATTTLCALLAPAARAQVRPLVPFAKQLILGGAFECMDELAIDAFVRPVFETVGLRERFVMAARSSDGSQVLPVAEAPTASISAEQHATMEPDLLFEHLLGHRERISFGSAHLALVGPLRGAWSLKHVSRVVEIVHATRPRPVGEIEIRLDALIVNKKSGLPGKGQVGELRGYTIDAWVVHFGAWSLCAHTGRELRESAPTRVGEPLA